MPLDEIVNDHDVRYTGAVYTPFEVSSALTRLALQSLPERNLSILEPSVGDGYFLSSIKGSSKYNQRHIITAIDIDSSVLAQVKLSLQDDFARASQFICANFVDYALDESKKFDLIIGNPPFIKKHNYSNSFKDSLDRLSKYAKYDLKDIKNAWAAFVIASERLLNDSGVLAFILPYELLTVAYGQKLQAELFSAFDRVDIYVPDERAFKDIEQDAVAIVAQKKCEHEHGVFLNRVNCLSEFHNPIVTRKVDHHNSSNISIDLKSFLLSQETVDFLHTLREKCRTVGDYTDSSPGLVTAANEYFILSRENAVRKGVFERCHPVVKKGSYVGVSPVFTRHDFNLLEEKQPCYFLHLKGEERHNFTKNVNDYIGQGEERGFQNRYKCRNREFWYEVPFVKSRPAFFVKRSYSHPRLCVNEADVLITDTAYGLAPKDMYTAKGLCYSFYNSLTLLFSEIDGRFYGGGVLELTPKEFRGLPLVYKEPTSKQFEGFLRAHHKKGDLAENLVKHGNRWLKTKLKLEDKEISMLSDAWRTIRNHRLRHGKK